MNFTQTSIEAMTNRCYEGPASQVGRYVTSIPRLGRFLEPRFYADQGHGVSDCASFLSVVDDFGSLRVVRHYLPASH